MTLCFKYWVSDNGEDSSIVHPSSESCDVEAFTLNEIIPGKFDPTSKYYINLIVYENGFIGSNTGINFAASDPQNDEKPSKYFRNSYMLMYYV